MLLTILVQILGKKFLIIFHVLKKIHMLSLINSLNMKIFKSFLNYSQNNLYNITISPISPNFSFKIHDPT